MINDHIEARLWGDHGGAFCKDMDRLVRFVLRLPVRGASKANKTVGLCPTIDNRERGVSGGHDDVG